MHRRLLHPQTDPAPYQLMGMLGRLFNYLLPPMEPLATPIAFERRNLVTLTPTAVEAVRRTMAEHPDQRFVRVTLLPQPEGDFAYQLDLTSEADPAVDVLGESQGVSVVVRREHADAIAGVTLDWRTGPTGEGFAFDAPPVQASSSTAPPDVGSSSPRDAVLPRT